MTPEEREKWIKEQMRLGGLTRAEAEFALAIELGEINGDLVEENGEDYNKEEP